MKKGIVSGVVRQALPEGAGCEQMLALAKASGFEGVELQHGAPPREFTEETSDADIRKIAEAARKHDIEVFSVMPTAQNLGSTDEAERKKGIDTIERVTRQAAILGAGTVLIVPCRVSEDCPYDAAYTNSLKSLQELADRVADTGIALAVENVWNKFLYSPLEFARYVDEVKRPNVKAYFDVGNIMAHGFPEQWIRILGKRIDKIHVKDYLRNRPGATGFTNLLQGDVPWGKVKKALDTVGYDGYVTAEVSGYATGAELGLKHITAALDYIFSL